MKVCCRCLCCELPPVVPGPGPAKPSTTLLASLLKPDGTADRGPEAVEKAGVLLGCPVGIKTCYHEPSKWSSSSNLGRHVEGALSLRMPCWCSCHLSSVVVESTSQERLVVQAKTNSRHWLLGGTSQQCAGQFTEKVA